MRDIRTRAIEKKLDHRQTAWLSLEFSILWFIVSIADDEEHSRLTDYSHIKANYFTAACLQYTSVSSSTILTSTSSIWTLLIGAVMGVEHFTLKKLIGVFACLAGVVLTSGVDISGDNDKDRGSFPHKSRRQIGVGDALALSSAVLYGIYTTLMKKRIGNEARVNMALFFGFVGLFNIVTLLPGFLVFHYTGLEPFELPPAGRIWTIILVAPDPKKQPDLKKRPESLN
ncbi:MAG: hypothetical protein LQ346_004266 [Caloplaca aetnensis]|nr:MAG: hypothetical protein LQ346_004266 [Caloplaca aetnensis]